MRQSLAHIKHNIDEINLLLKTGKTQIQKIISSAHFICLQARVPGTTYYIYLGRGDGYEGIWWSRKNLMASMRVRDKFLSYLRSRMRGLELGSFTSSIDRIVGINYQNKYFHGALLFFYGKPKLVFIDIYTDNDMVCIFCPAISLKIIKKERELDKSDLTDIAISYLKKLGYRNLEINQDSEALNDKRLNEFSIEDYLNGKNLAQGINRSKKKKFIKRKIENISKDLEKVKKWKEIQKILMEDSFDKYFDCDRSYNFIVRNGYFIYQNIKIFVGYEQNKFKIRDKLFEKMKNFKKAQVLLEARLKDTIEKESEESKVTQEDRPNFSEKEKKEGVIAPYWHVLKNLNSGDFTARNFVLFEINGVKGAIGKNAKGNEEMRSKWAKKDDVWIHLEGYHSAHMILKVSNILELGTAFLKALAGMLIERNSLELREASIIYCPVKQLKGVKGQLGKVIYNKVKYLKIECDRNWREIISINANTINNEYD